MLHNFSIDVALEHSRSRCVKESLKESLMFSPEKKFILLGTDLEVELPDQLVQIH